MASTAARTTDAAAAANDKAAEETQLVSGKVVKYIGTSDVRDIDAASWRNVGSNSSKAVWAAKNRFMVDAADLDDAALEYCEGDPDFVIMDAPVKKR